MASPPISDGADDLPRLLDRDAPDLQHLCVGLLVGAATVAVTDDFAYARRRERAQALQIGQRLLAARSGSDAVPREVLQSASSPR
jgi:hypothetical protein